MLSGLGLLEYAVFYGRFLAQVVGPNVPVGIMTATPVPAGYMSSTGVNFLAILFVLLLLGVIGFAAYKLIKYYIKLLREKYKEKTMKNYIMYVVRVPKSDETAITAMEQVFASIYSIYKKKKLLEKILHVDEPVSFEIIGYKNYIGFFVYAPKKYAEFIEAQITGAYQSAEVVPVKEPVFITEQSFLEMGYISTTDKKGI